MPRVTITLPGKNSQPYRFALDRKQVTLGRGSENDIIIDNGSVSVAHAVMERVRGGYQLRDLGSTNGTKIGSTRKDEIDLMDDMTVRLGDVDFHFTLTSEEQITLGTERPEGSPLIKEEEHAPHTTRQAQMRQPALRSAQQTSAAAGFFITLLFLVLAVAAFYVGLTIRYSKENSGASLTQAILNPEEAKVPAQDDVEEAGSNENQPSEDAASSAAPAESAAEPAEE